MHNFFLKIPAIIAGLLSISLLAGAQPKIILKLDDFGSKNGMTSAEPVLNDLLKRKIKASLGVIVATLDNTAPQAYKKYVDAQDEKGDKLFEIWNHGYDHSYSNPPNNNQEFNGTSYRFQAEHLEKAHKRVEELLGVKMRTFGAPYNQNDTTFNKVAAANGNYDRFFFSYKPEYFPAGAKRLNNGVTMEITTGNVNYEHFINQYTKSNYKDYIVLQGHPNQWDSARLAEFDKILDYLIAQHAEFILPHDPFFK